MDSETKYFIVRCASAFLYKEAYFKSSKGLTPNTWSFIITQNMKQPGCISLTNRPKEWLIEKYVRLSGNGPIDFSKLSKRPKRRIPLMPIYQYMNEHGSTDSDEEFSLDD
jgi:hypothetical protein